MKAKFLAVIIILLLSAGVALAETYQIQVRWPVRLRASYSLDSPVVAEALAGEVLQVVDRFNRWLKIDRNGVTAWLADWVDYSRLDQTQTSPAAETSINQQAPSDIDNCCFVDRQCHSEQEWVDGYLAYQRGECPAGTTSAQQTSTGGSGASNSIDNCCFVNRECASEQEWVDGYAAYSYDSSCEASVPASIAVGSHPGVHVDGSERFRAQVNAALDLIKRRSGRWYHYTVSGISRVRPVRHEERGMDVYQRTYRLSNRTAFLGGQFLTDDSLTWLAGVLVHEACHVYARQRGYKYNNVYERFREEVICQQVQIEALDEIDVPRNRWRQYLSGLINNWKAEGHDLPRSEINELKRYPR